MILLQQYRLGVRHVSPHVSVLDFWLPFLCIPRTGTRSAHTKKRKQRKWITISQRHAGTGRTSEAEKSNSSFGEERVIKWGTFLFPFFFFLLFLVGAKQKANVQWSISNEKKNACPFAYGSENSQSYTLKKRTARTEESRRCTGRGFCPLWRSKTRQKGQTLITLQKATIMQRRKTRFSHRFLVKPLRVTARGEELTFNWIYWHINGWKGLIVH